MSAIHFILYFQGMEGAVVSDRNGVCVISCAVEGKGAKLDPFMRCDTFINPILALILSSDQRIKIDSEQLAGSIWLYDSAQKLNECLMFF